MAFPFDPTNSRVRTSATQGGTYVAVGKVVDYDHNEGTEGGGTTKYFGGQVERAGDPTLEGSFNILWDNTDATGQEVIKAAKRAGTPLWFQFAPEGTATGAKVEQFQANVTNYRINSNAQDADNLVKGSISLKGDPTTLSTVTLA
jgi:hypothetical protein